MKARLQHSKRHSYIRKGKKKFIVRKGDQKQIPPNTMMALLAEIKKLTKKSPRRGRTYSRASWNQRDSNKINSLATEIRNLQYQLSKPTSVDEVRILKAQMGRAEHEIMDIYNNLSKLPPLDKLQAMAALNDQFDLYSKSYSRKVQHLVQAIDKHEKAYRSASEAGIIIEELPLLPVEEILKSVGETPESIEETTQSLEEQTALLKEQVKTPRKEETRKERRNEQKQKDKLAALEIEIKYLEDNIKALAASSIELQHRMDDLPISAKEDHDEIVIKLRELAKVRSDNEIDLRELKKLRSKYYKGGTSGIYGLLDLYNIQGGGNDDALYGHQIDRIAKSIDPNYIGLCFSDGLYDLVKPAIKENNGWVSAMINSLNSKEAKPDSVGHYLCFIIDHGNETVILYDPLAMDVDGMILEQISKLLKYTPTLYQFKTNTVRNQDWDTSTCGLHCLNFLSRMVNGDTFQQATYFDKIDGSVAGEDSVSKFKLLVKKEFPDL